ncbi:MAG: methyltransferase domain-containing protein [Dehalococcoidia bacterium]|nr:methyltransferase domain-containing protein [Dehalococcoidia bacterium]
MVSSTNPYDDPRIAALYDLENRGGPDTRFYVDLAAELAAAKVGDIGCGTGLLTCELAGRGNAMVGVDPAGAMLDVARGRPEAHLVTWIQGDASRLGAEDADLVIMTGHAAQEVHGDEGWAATLAATRRALRPGGHLAFESRNPQARGWEDWTPERTRARLEHPELGAVDIWYRLLAVDGDLVRFEAHNRFASSGKDLTVVGELRFRAQADIERSLATAGFTVQRVFGDWERGPVNSRSPELIFLAVASEGSPPT